MTVAANDDTTVPSASVVDLDKARAVRREGRGDNLEVVNKGQRFLLPVELPVDAVGPLAGLADLPDRDEEAPGEDELVQIRTALEGGLAALFCDEQPLPLGEDDQVPTRGSEHSAECAWRRFLGTRPSLDDELELWAGLFAAYGTTLGEALASLDSSQSGGRPANQTPKGSTASSSQPPAGDRASTKARGKASSSRARKRTTAKAGGGTKRAAGTRASRS